MHILDIQSKAMLIHEPDFCICTDNTHAGGFMVKIISNLQHVLFVLLIFPAALLPQSYTWKVIAQPEGNAWHIQFVDTLHGWLRTNQYVWRTTDGGFTWEHGPGFTTSGYGVVSFINTQMGWTCGNKEVSKTTDGGKSWQRIYDEYSNPKRNYLSWIQFTDSLRGYLVARDTVLGTRLLRTTNGGETWSSTTFPGVEAYNTIQFKDSLRGYIASKDLLFTVDGGLTWAKQYFDPYEFAYIQSMSIVDSLNVWACNGTDPPHIIRTRNAGKTWENIPIQLGVGPRTISMLDTLNGWLFGEIFYDHDLANAIYRTRDGGFTWTLESIGITTYLMWGQVIDSCHAWAVAADGHVLVLVPSATAVERTVTSDESLTLSQNYPNPFNGETEIKYTLPEDAHVTITLTDVLGRMVAKIMNEEQHAGTHTQRLALNSLASGDYWLTLRSGTAVISKKIIHLK